MVQDTFNEKTLLKPVDNGCVSEIKYNFWTLLATNDMKQIDLANELGIDKAYISRMVHGEQIPPLHMMLKVARILKTDTRIIWGCKCWR